MVGKGDADHQHQIVNRKNTQHSTGVESLDAAGSPPRRGLQLQEDFRDEEPAQAEEQNDSRIAPTNKFRDESTAHKMADEDRRNRQRTNAVELRIMLPVRHEL